MAGFVSTNAHLLVNAVDLSSRVKEVNLSYEADAVENTTMSPVGVKSHIGGLKNIGLRARFSQDYAASGAGSVDATLFPILGTQVAITTKPVNAAISTTNPEYQTTLLLQSYGPASGTVGAEAQTEAVFVSAGAALTRDTTP